MLGYKVSDLQLYSTIVVFVLGVISMIAWIIYFIIWFINNVSIEIK